MSAKAKAWFKPVTTSRSLGLAVAKCETWKAVACRKGKCTVKKAVRCLGVCQMQGQGGPRKMLGDCTKTGKRLGTFANKAVVKADGVYGPEKGKGKRLRRKLWSQLKTVRKDMCATTEVCDEKLCKGEHGVLACKEVAMML